VRDVQIGMLKDFRFPLLIPLNGRAPLDPPRCLIYPAFILALWHLLDT
jgi:hypothetical protein